MRVADYLMQRLVEAGIRQIFFLPGGGAMHLDDALACERRLDPIHCHHEQACGIAAEANGRVSPAGFGVALVTTGPGATNILTPVAGAWIESLPLLVISGQVKRADRLSGRPLRQGGVQEVDIVPIVRPVTKYAVMVEDPMRIRYHLEEALWWMHEGRPGPIWLDIPLDVQAAPIEPEMLAGFEPPVTETADLNLPLARIANLLEQAERPLLLAGHGVRIAGGEAVFRALAERLGAPSVFTWNAADLLPWEHPLYVGRPGVVAARAPNFAVQNCDFLLSVGCRLDNILTAYNPHSFAPHAVKVVVDVDSRELARHEMPIELRIEADAKAFLEAWLARQPPPGDWAAWRTRCADWKRRYPPLDNRAFATVGEIGHYPFVEALSETIPEDRLVVTGSSGLAVEVFYTAFRNKPGQRLFLTSGLGAMGYGLPAVIGACLGGGRRPTVGIESDGSLMLNVQELATLKALDLPITLIVMNNDGYASIRNTQRNYFEERYLGTGPEAGQFMFDWMRLCEALDIPASRIERIEDLGAGLAHAMAQRGPYVCEVKLTPVETLAPKVAAIPQPDGSMLSMPLEDMSPLLSLAQLQAEMLNPLEPASIKVRADG